MTNSAGQIATEPYMTYATTLKLAYDRQLFGARAYNLERSPGETRSSREIFSDLCFTAAFIGLKR